MRVFVTGGTGFIGSRVVRILVEQGHQVRVLLRETSDPRRIADLAWEPVIGNMRDPESLASGIEGCDGAIHLASPSSWDEIASDEVEPVIIGGTTALLEAAERIPGLRLVYVSSMTALNGSKEPRVYDESATFNLVGSGLRYAEAKHKAEEIVAAAAARGLHVTTVLPGETYGAGDDEWITAGPIKDALKSWPALSLKGGTSIAHVDDVAAGVVAALTKGRSGERYILGGDNLTVTEILRTSLKLAGQKKPVITLPEWLVRAVSKTCVALRITPPLAPDLIGYAARYWFASSAKAIQELGYQPRSGEETLRDVVEWITSGTTTAHPPS